MDVHFCSLEPDIMTPKTEPVSLVVEVLVYNPGAHVCRTRIHKQILVTDCTLEKGPQWHTLLTVDLETIQGKRWALSNQQTVSFAQHQHDLGGLLNVVETCSGLGAVGRGFEACGASTCCYNDSNAEFHKWLEHHTQIPCILGNLVDHSTIKRMREEIKGPHVLSSGISCQPFSKMGDRREYGDPRSESFPGTLAMSYYLGSLAVILECTSEAMTSEWVQTTLKRFASETGYTLTQNVLSLHRSWPGKRDRWWAVLAHSQRWTLFTFLICQSTGSNPHFFTWFRDPWTSQMSSCNKSNWTMTNSKVSPPSQVGLPAKSSICTSQCPQQHTAGVHS